MMGVVNKFVIASMCMFAAPITILYGFNHNFLPGKIPLPIYIIVKRCRLVVIPIERCNFWLAFHF